METVKIYHCNFTQTNTEDNGTSTFLSVMCSDTNFSFLTWHIYFMNII